MKQAAPIRLHGCILTLLAFLVIMPLAAAQNAAPNDPATKSAKTLAFEVVSIRSSQPGARVWTSWGTTPDGYRVIGQSIFGTIMLAYFPQGRIYWSKDRISGAPAWLNEPYDINAKVPEADLAEWQKQGEAMSARNIPTTALDKIPLLRAMLQTMLADRCHLVAHMVPGPPVSGWSIESGKHVPHLTESKPGEALPEGMRLHDGGVIAPYQRGEKPRLAFYGATMVDLAEAMSGYANHPVQDHTGLSGRYDFVVEWVDDPDSKIHEGTVSPNDPDPLSHWNIQALGFNYVPVKVPIDTLVIDHIEKPSEN